MSLNEIPFPVVGNLTEDPELRFTPNGAAVAQMTVAHNPKRLDRQTGEFVDGDPTFIAVTVWNQLAEHVAESLTRGDRVVVLGTYSEDRWEDREGNKRSRPKVTAYALGPDLRFATAKPSKVKRNAPPNDEFASASHERPDEPADAAAQ